VGKGHTKQKMKCLMLRPTTRPGLAGTVPVSRPG